MELNKIESLLIKYDEGETSLSEEQILQQYFRTGQVPPHLKEYKLIFSYSEKAKNSTFEKNIVLPNRKKRFGFIAIAASIVIAMGIFFAVNNSQEEMNQHNLGTIENPEEAYLKAKETLQLVSEALNTGREELTYVEEFDKAKNKYIKE